MPNSAEVNSIKRSWLYGRAQQREIELREIWKKTRNLDMLTGTVQHTMHGHEQHTVPHRHLQQKTSSKKKPQNSSDIKKNKSWGFTSRGKQSTLAVTCSQMQDCCWCLVSLFFDDDIGFPLLPVVSQCDPLIPTEQPKQTRSQHVLITHCSLGHIQHLAVLLVSSQNWDSVCLWNTNETHRVGFMKLSC